MTPSTAVSPTISDTEFEKFRDFFYQRTGISFDQTKRYFVDKRLVERMQQTGHDSFRAYFMYLRFEQDCDELQQLTNQLTVNETYFFREDYQLKCMVRSVLAELTRKRDPSLPIRILSLPCSTGEEPYSIAIYLLEYWSAIDDFQVEVFGSDIDTSVLQRCERGRYSKRSVHQLPPAVLAKHFKALGDNDFQISTDLREAVCFRRVNVCSPMEMRSYRDFDIVFCRNMLIYFDDVSRLHAVTALYDALRPGGFVFLGHSESMSRITSLFSVRRFQDAIVYQKPHAGEEK